MGNDCNACNGSAHESKRRGLEKIVHLLMIAGGDAVSRAGVPVPHPWFRGTPIIPVIPGIEEITGGLAGRAPSSPFGHDAIDRHNATRKIIRAAGLDPDTWGICPRLPDARGRDPGGMG